MVKISIDVDGVLADFTKAFVKVLNKSSGFEMVPSNYQPPEWNWPDRFGVGVQAAGWAMVKETKDFWLGLDPLPGARELYEFFYSGAAQKVEIYFVTARARSLGQTLAAQTRQWIETHVGWANNWNVITVDSSDKKPQVFESVGIKYSLDDYDKTVRYTQIAQHPTIYRTLQCEHHPFLLNQSWNHFAHDLDSVRVYSVAEYLNLIKEREDL